MIPLGQGEMFDPPPTRRLIVSGPHGWAGVDPSTKRCSIATVSAEGVREVRTVSFPDIAPPLRLAEIHKGVCDLWSQMNRRIGVVLVEQPSGKRENPALSYAVGVTVAALASVDGMWPVNIEMVTSSAWKKVACGYGAIYKPKSPGGEYGVLTWARSVGYTGSSWDEADAMGIVECARKTFLLEER